MRVWRGRCRKTWRVYDSCRYAKCLRSRFAWANRSYRLDPGAEPVVGEAWRKARRGPLAVVTFHLSYLWSFRTRKGMQLKHFCQMKKWFLILPRLVKLYPGKFRYLRNFLSGGPWGLEITASNLRWMWYVCAGNPLMSESEKQRCRAKANPILT